MQKDKTKDYWDTFYTSSKINNCDESSADFEWIVPTNSPELLDIIFSIFPLSSDLSSGKCNNCDPTTNVLEIGCGVSQLSISLLKHILQKIQENANSGRAYHITATDISSASTEHNRLRDNAFISSLDTKYSLSYKVLDALNVETLSETFDVILDKGTLDTFLFRTKRTKKGSSSHPPILKLLLNNIHHLLRTGRGARYIIISPRSKIKSVRDFRGFASVRSYKIDTSASGGNIVVKGNSGKTEVSSEVYLYECIKNDSYNPEKDEPFSGSMCEINDDNLTCSKCEMTYVEYHKGQVVHQGEIVWARRWKNHRIHCKG